MTASDVPQVVISGRDSETIGCLDGWYAHARPAGGWRQWVDGHSAKEQANAWLRDGSPAVPAEILAALEEVGVADVLSVTAYPEHETPLDRFGRGGRGNRNHDVLMIARRRSGATVVVGIEAKACEDFDGVVATRIAAAPPSNQPHRANLLARALFGRDVCDLDTGSVLSPDLAAAGYQLWTAAVGTLIEAAKHDVALAIVIVHQFAPDPASAVRPGDRRNWRGALADNNAALTTFAAAVEAAGGVSRSTEFVRAGIQIRIAKALAPLATDTTVGLCRP